MYFMDRMSDLISAKEFAKLVVNEDSNNDLKTFNGFATVKDFAEDGFVYVQLDGHLDVSGKERPIVSSYKPRIGDRVVIYRDVVLGKLGKTEIHSTKSTEDKRVKDKNIHENVWLEWMTVPYKGRAVTVHFNKKYRTKPSVSVQPYSSSNYDVELDFLEGVDDEGIKYYQSVMIKLDGVDNTDIGIQIVGRIDVTDREDETKEEEG